MAKDRTATKRIIATWAIVAMGASFFVPVAFPGWFPHNKNPPAFLIFLALVNFAFAFWYFQKTGKK
jgi:hypothetical protein